MQEENIGSNDHLLSRHQVRAGRVLAGLGVRDLASAAGISPTALSQIETGRTSQPHEVTLRSLRHALEGQGVEFGMEGWVRHRDDTSLIRSLGHEDSLPRTIARACKEARTKLGISHDEIAEKVGESVELYARIEAGSLLPPLSTLIRVADVLQISTDQMFGRVLLQEAPSLTGIGDLDPTQARKLFRLLQAARPTAIRVVILVLKEVIRLQKRDAETSG